MTSLLERLPGLSRTFPRRPAPASYISDLERVIANLERLNAGTEQEFLAVGGQLMSFRSTARELSNGITALTGLFNGEHGARVASALNSILQYSRDANARLAQSGKALEELRAQAAHIRAAFNGLPRMVSIFRTVCTLIRIETARLGASGADFGSLAAEVQPLSESIQASGEGVLEACSLLERDVLASLSRSDELRARQLDGVAQVIGGVGEDLGAFEERRRRAAAASLQQAAQVGEVSQALDGAVRAIQFHDITRQQLEHVIAALAQAIALPDHERPALLRLQAAQLAAAAATFETSTANLSAELQRIADRVQGMAQCSRDLNGTSAGEQESFFLHLERHLTGVLKMLQACGEARGQGAGLAGALQETTERMLKWVAEIRGIEIRIQRIALNAAVRAAHIGPPGDALVVVAGVMLRVAADSNSDTENVSVILQSMGGAVDRHWRGEASPESAAGIDVTSEMQRSAVDLHSASEISFSRVEEIAMLGARLAGEIATARESFSAGALFASVAGEALAELERLAALGGPSRNLAEELDGLSARYTMQAERDVHELSVRGGEHGSPGLAPDASLGDNVELF